MNYKDMVIKCIQEDCLKASNLKNACSVFQRYIEMSDSEIIQIYNDYFGLESKNDDGFTCLD